MLCAICTENVAPRLVNQRAARSWAEFSANGRKVPTTPGFRARLREYADE
jgi:hypothetical protein